MTTREADELVGLDIVYKDYLGYERTGKIGWYEHCSHDEYDDEGNLIVWIYVVDEDPEYNVHEFIFNASADPSKPDVKRLMYADLRLSSEVVIDE